MKNFTFTAIFATFCLAVSAQQITVDFEGLPLNTAETFYNGSDEAGFYSIQNTRFENNFNTLYSTWSGCAYSNVTDNTTAGFMNQFSSFAGSGFNSSSIYGIYTQEGKISFETGKVFVDSLKITNTTYAAITMRDGDPYSKQFGSVNGPDNLPDGTDGKDFFKIWIYGLDENDVKIDSVAFYLADFRSNNAVDHYILDSWKNVPLSSLGAVHGLSFGFESSDNGEWGMNTPAYFAFDNLTYTPTTLSVNQLVKNEISVYPNPFENEVHVKGGNGNLIISDLTGKTVYTANHITESNIDLSFLNQGMYVISINDNGAVCTQMIKK